MGVEGRLQLERPIIGAVIGLEVLGGTPLPSEVYSNGQASGRQCTLVFILFADLSGTWFSRIIYWAG